MTVDTKVLTYDELVVWFEMLSKLSDCRGLAVQYAQRNMRTDLSWKTRWIKAVTGSKRKRETGAS